MASRSSINTIATRRLSPLGAHRDANDQQQQAAEQGRAEPSNWIGGAEEAPNVSIHGFHLPAPPCISRKRTIEGERDGSRERGNEGKG